MYTWEWYQLTDRACCSRFSARFPFPPLRFLFLINSTPQTAAPPKIQQLRNPQIKHLKERASFMCPRNPIKQNRESIFMHSPVIELVDWSQNTTRPVTTRARLVDIWSIAPCVPYPIGCKVSTYATICQPMDQWVVFFINLRLEKCPNTDRWDVFVITKSVNTTSNGLY